MALNVEQITSRLAQMPDAALQKYAAMNKNDPYIMALAVSESNRRKQMRQAAQAQQGQAPQPKVVDAAVQSMAQPMPEDMGIARLPAGDMNFADGGIVAFADGGEVERYNGSTGSLVSLTAEQLAKLYQIDPNLAQQARRGALTQTALRMASPALAAEAILGGGVALSADAAQTMAGMSPEQRRQFYSNPMVGATAGDAGIAGAILNAPDMAAPTMSYGDQMKNLVKSVPRALTSGFKTLVSAPGYGLNREDIPAAPAATPYDPATATRRSAFETPSAGPGASGAGRATPKADATQRGSGAPGAPGATKPPAAGAAGVANPNLDVAALTKKALDSVDPKANPFAAEIEAAGKEKVAAAEASAKGLKAIHDKFSDIYKGREERLNKREAELGRMKDQNLGLALLQAGAAMMSTVGNVGTAIGRGIDTGSKQYVAGLDKLNAAKEKLSDARDRLDELNAQRGELSAREQLKAENDIKTAGITAREDLIKSNMQMYGVNRETALKMVDNQIQVALGQLKEEGLDRRSQNEIQGRITAANIAAGSQREYVEALRGGTMVETARKNIMNEIIKANPYADEATRQMLFQREWTKALQNNPALAKYSGVAPGGGGAASADPLGLRQ